jgi:hypothetical protein
MEDRVKRASAYVYLDVAMEDRAKRASAHVYLDVAMEVRFCCFVAESILLT